MAASSLFFLRNHSCEWLNLTEKTTKKVLQRHWQKLTGVKVKKSFSSDLLARMTGTKVALWYHKTTWYLSEKFLCNKARLQIGENDQNSATTDKV